MNTQDPTLVNIMAIAKGKLTPNLCAIVQSNDEYYGAGVGGSVEARYRVPGWLHRTFRRPNSVEGFIMYWTRHTSNATDLFTLTR